MDLLALAAGRREGEDWQIRGGRKHGSAASPNGVYYMLCGSGCVGVPSRRLYKGSMSVVDLCGIKWSDCGHFGL